MLFKETHRPISPQNAQTQTSGFTLIELSIVLVIIGLLAGGVLVGRDLIKAAEVRATISQIEKYNTAVNTFRGKYGYLPGDLNNVTAIQFGFSQRGSSIGEGDGNGVIQGVFGGGGYSGRFVFGGETEMFWVDLTTANGLNLGLIDGSFSNNNMLAPPASVSLTQIGQYMPEAKLGGGNYVYVWSGDGGGNTWPSNALGNINFFGLSAVTGCSCTFGGTISNSTIPVQQAYSMDKKVDDGYPQSGKVLAMYAGGTWSGVSDQNFGPNLGGPTTIATPGSSSTCYDNGNVAGVTQQYSLATNGGAGTNCALSFMFQ